MAALQNIETIKAQGLEHEVFSSWGGHLDTLLQARKQLEHIATLLRSGPLLLSGIANLAVIGPGRLACDTGAP